jgi:hypothetical protein
MSTIDAQNPCSTAGASQTRSRTLQEIIISGWWTELFQPLQMEALCNDNDGKKSGPHDSVSWGRAFQVHPLADRPQRTMLVGNVGLLHKENCK